MRHAPRLVTLALATLAGCGARASLSITSYTTVTCDDCGATPALVGRPVRLVLDWPGTEPEPDGTVVGPPRWTIACAGAPCHVGAEREDQVQGDAMVEVVPDGDGPLVVQVILDDGVRRRTIELDRLVVAPVEAIALACTSRPPGVRTYVPCPAEVPAGHDVRVVATVQSGGRAITGVPLAATLDGHEVASLTAPGAADGWRCGVTRSTAAAEAAMVCAVDGVRPGEHVLVTRLGAVAATLPLVVR